ncbi:hypothetical protein [Sporosarcina pasteurii]|uniref:Uncharacterized protein n=1 Tax=Sporosarcina pasteurii TaxID=1474 RepID=A0A380CC38_SPOPA|nr:hypothetical protein [Sporosarcina pasteurii]MDS9473150.1 hypothetical protein [Sporosarcina pasteurii]QBQ04206.1 hypothetical protein E2C16_00015 [Sporosarcina pasteurii]SUJ17459.1 Uncharacterised protein [Sporosarcina pasteurii]
MRKFKEWANSNSWWLPWVGVTATISSLMFPAAYLKMGEIIALILQIFKKYWILSVIVCWGIYTHLEVLKLKNNRCTSGKDSKKNIY